MTRPFIQRLAVASRCKQPGWETCAGRLIRHVFAEGIWPEEADAKDQSKESEHAATIVHQLVPEVKTPRAKWL